MNFLKKTFAIISIISILNLYTIPTAHAVDLDFGLPEAIASALLDIVSPALELAMEELHISGEGTEFLTETINVFKGKNKEPEVDLFFSPTNPKTGEKIKATAYVSNFKDATNDSLYFTWYLKHNDGSGDGYVTINGKDYKTEDGNINWYDKDDVIDIKDYKIEAMRIAANGGWDARDATYNGDADEDEDGIKGLKEEANDGEDDTNLPFGGLGVQEPESGFRCYVKDYKDGLFYELIEEDVSEENNPPTTDDFGERSIYDANVPACDICGEDKPAQVRTCVTSYIVEDTCAPMTETNNLLWFGTGDVHLKIPGYRKTLPPGCSVCIFCDTDEDGEEYETQEVCAIKTGEQVGEDDPGDYAGEDSLCTHIFPHAPGFTTGDGEFTDEEEKFWGTNPKDPDTNDDGINDEASVAGIGLDELEWTYSKGDELGLIVEGQSQTSTKYFDGGYMVMWALPKNNFDVPDTDCRIKNKQPYVVTIMDLPVIIPAANFDVEECLKYNFVNPMDGEQPEKMEVEMTHGPSNPRNDTKGENGDVLSFTASVLNPESENDQVYYKWRIEGGSEMSNNDGKWSNLSNDPAFRKATNIQYLEKLGMDTLRLNLNYPGMPEYIRVTVETEEYHQSADVTKRGRMSEIVKIHSNSADGIKFKSNTSSEEICSDQVICTALNNQIITASLVGKFSNFSWTVNGSQASQNGGSDYQTVKEGNTINFPIIGEPGKLYVVSVTANSSDSKESITSSRTIKIINPTMDLSVEGAKPKVYGQYVDLDDETVDDESSTIFESDGSDVTITANLNPSWISPEPEISWIINGKAQDTHDTSIALSGVGEYAGDRIDVTAKATYAQSSTTRAELRDNWDVSQFTSTEVPMESSITINVQEAPKEFGVAGKIMANITSNFPAQVTFLFRMVLTVIMTLFISSLIMSFERNPK